MRNLAKRKVLNDEKNMLIRQQQATDLTERPSNDEQHTAGRRIAKNVPYRHETLVELVYKRRSAADTVTGVRHFGRLHCRVTGNPKLLQEQVTISAVPT